MESCASQGCPQWEALCLQMWGPQQGSLAPGAAPTPAPAFPSATAGDRGGFPSGLGAGHTARSLLATGLRQTRLFSLLPAAQDPLPPLQAQPCSPRPSFSFEETYFLFALPRDQPQPQPETPGNPSTRQPACGTPALLPGLLDSHISEECFSFLNFI